MKGKRGAMVHREELWILSIAVLAGCLIAASHVGPFAQTPLLIVYLYWVVRILAETGLFLGCRVLTERFVPASRGSFVQLLLAMVLSLVPFVLLITAFDLVLGYPELGLDTRSAGDGSRWADFGLELLYLADNHLVLCLLVSIPRFIREYSKREAEEAAEPTNSFLQMLEPPLDGDLQWVEAQEHYVRLIATGETRMVLHRFSDIVRELPGAIGLQVHRSHWVALEAIQSAFKDGANLKLKLRSGDAVPVSRSFRKAVEAVLEDR